MELCGKDRCTGCGACLMACPNNSIYYAYDEYGTNFAKINKGKCIHCGMCLRVCHVEKKMEARFPLKVYAAWSSDSDRHSQAASGGVATEIYRYALLHGMFVMGTCFEREKGVIYREIVSDDDIKWARDSKYVYSDMALCFDEYAVQLSKKRKCIFIGLPCQVAALKTYLKERRLESDNNLFCVDLICHGVPSWHFLDEHLRFIESRKKTVVRRVTFRNPDSSFFLHCYNTEDKLIYNRTCANDAYYKAFEVNLDFRDSCYQCQYAKKERISDLTIGDYSGLGRLCEYSGSTLQVSVVMVHSKAGQRLVCDMVEESSLEVVERPLEEPASAQKNPQLRHPAVPYKNRERFLKYYVNTQNYEFAVRSALSGLFLLYYLGLPFECFKKLMIRFLPVKLKQRIKKLLRR